MNKNNITQDQRHTKRHPELPTQQPTKNSTKQCAKKNAKQHAEQHTELHSEQRAVQLELFPKEKTAYVFGGASTLGKRKVARTILPKKWIHLCLKSKRAVGVYSLLHPRVRGKIENLIRQKAKKFLVELNAAVNMGNHIHMKIRVRRKADFIRFIRSIAGLVARLVTGAKKGLKFGRFWDAIAFTRMIMTSFEELGLRGYFKANRIEKAKGYQARHDFLNQFNKWLYGLRKTTSTA